MVNSEFKEKVILAYSGGLDTSIIIPWLKENYDYEVIAFAADVGQGDELEPVREKAIKTGASKILYRKFAGRVCYGFYLSYYKKRAQFMKAVTFWEHPSRVPASPKKWSKSRKKRALVAICHGATGKGNDQVRFELTVKALAPHLKIIAPWRIWDIKSRDDAIDYANARGIPIPVSKKTITAWTGICGIFRMRVRIWKTHGTSRSLINC